MKLYMRKIQKSHTEHVRALFGYLSVCIVVAVMAGASDLFEEREIIFPEIAALATGMLAVRNQSWQVSRKRMISAIACASAAGTILAKMTLSADISMWAAVAAAYAAGQLLFFFSKTDFAPVISAAAMPVILGTDSWIYPLSAVAMTSVTALIQKGSEKAGLRRAEKFQLLPLPGKEEWIKAVIRILCAAVLTAAASAAGCRFCIAPPLLVVFTEMTRRTFPGRKERLKSAARSILIIFFCALFGAVSREILVETAGLPVTAASVSAAVLCMALMSLSRFFFPPAAALAILPMIIPQEHVISYQFQVCFGGAVFAAAAFVIGELSARFSRFRSKIS